MRGAPYPCCPIAYRYDHAFLKLPLVSGVVLPRAAACTRGGEEDALVRAAS